MQPSIERRRLVHCSGGNFPAAAKREMPAEPILCTTGNWVTFSA